MAVLWLLHCNAVGTLKHKNKAGQAPAHKQIASFLQSEKVSTMTTCPRMHCCRQTSVRHNRQAELNMPVCVIDWRTLLRQLLMVCSRLTCTSPSVQAHCSGYMPPPAPADALKPAGSTHACCPPLLPSTRPFLHVIQQESVSDKHHACTSNSQPVGLELMQHSN